ncbi:MAG TPA: alpha/beta fold hydrolase [Gemmatimonadaceae bacterium]|nr:alpha/beta fold hydrolase [Gemmatimonadaceae bacterium]
MPELVSIDGLTAVAVPADAGAATGVGGRPKPPVLFVHGMMVGAWVFERYQRLFAAHGYASWAVNLRGHCGSRPVPDLGRVSLQYYVNDAMEAARALAAAHGVERPVIVGHSMGGLIAQVLAERDAVEAAVLLCSAPPRGITVSSLRLAYHQLRYLWPILRGRPLVARPAGASALNFNRVPPAERAGLYARMVPESGRVGLELSLGMVSVDDRRVTRPVLVCAAADDRLVPARVARRLAKKYDAPYREFADHGHFLVYEPNWEGPATEIAHWLDETVIAMPAATETAAGRRDHRPLTL